MYTIKKQTYGNVKNTEQEIVGLFHELAAVYERYRKQIQIAATAVLAVLVLSGGYTLYQESRDKKASALLSQADDLYHAAQPDYSKAYALFKQVRTDYAGTVSAEIAQYYAGNCLMDTGRTQEAVTEYQGLISRGGNKEVAGLASQRMGYAYAAMGNTAEALNSFERAETLLGPGVASIEAARLLEATGKTAEAAKKYAAIAGAFPGAASGEKAKKTGTEQGKAGAGQAPQAK